MRSETRGIVEMGEWRTRHSENCGLPDGKKEVGTPSGHPERADLSSPVPPVLMNTKGLKRGKIER
jgi:hypothetical protein